MKVKCSNDEFVLSELFFGVCLKAKDNRLMIVREHNGVLMYKTTFDNAKTWTCWTELPKK